MKSIKTLPQVAVDLINQLIVTQEIYLEIYRKYSDRLLQEELKRLALEKKIFLKDFNCIKDFNLTEHLDNNRDEIRINKENLVIRINHLFLEKEEEDVVKFIIERERKLVDLYYLLFKEKVEDDFIRMILKNQLEETERSLLGLEEIKANLNV